jgi:hypothetical protein
VQMRSRSSGSARPPLAIPHWARGLALGVLAAVVLHVAATDMVGFPRAAVLLAFFLLVLATSADVVWHVWTCRKPAPAAALSGGSETVSCYAERLRMWVTAGTIVLASATTTLHGADAMSVLRAWGQLHRWAPPEIALRITPLTVNARQPFHVTVLVDNRVAGGYRCEWRGPVGEWSGATTCDILQVAPAHFVEPDWPTRRISVGARVFDGDHLLGSTSDETITITYAPMVELSVDKTRIIQGQKAEFRVQVDGRAPGPDDRCRWTVGGEFASSDRCTFTFTGKELTGSSSTAARIAVEVENKATHAIGTAEVAIDVDQPQSYVVYLVEASHRMAQQGPAGTILDDVKNDLVEGLSNTDLGKEYLGIATFGEDGSRPPCYANVQVPYPIQPLNLNEAKSVVYLLQPGATDAPLTSALLKGLTLFRPYAQRAAQHASFALVSIAAGPDTCAGRRPEDAIAPMNAVMDGVRQTTAQLRGRLLTLTIGVAVTDLDRHQWDVLAKFAPSESPYVIIPAPDIVTLDQAVRASVQLGSRDYDTRLSACATLARILRSRSFETGSAQVERFCRTMSTP